MLCILYFGTITAVCGTIIHCHPMKIEIYDNGIKFNRKFYRWSELKAYRNGEYIILNVKKRYNYSFTYEQAEL